ncbi:M20 family metallo-hydrolase [Candidatus Sumerlaeota bacterium]|nr:M20 family metallo-hydrolase [Candidatus Sumerlaeota bacterium]
MIESIRCNMARLGAELEKLSSVTEATPPAVTRVVFSDADLRARNFFKDLCRKANLRVREDGIGNIFARWQGSDPGAAAVGTGSHTDAIPNAGLYDGVVGVLGGLEAIRILQEKGFEPRRSIELLMFATEEPTRFGVGCLGSRAIAGTYDEAKILSLRDGDGRNPSEAARRIGLSGEMNALVLSRDYYDAFVELHIEQGPVLERIDLPIGIVTAIAAPASMRITFEGEGGHAGTVLMADRRDALLAGAELALAVDEIARATGSPDTVGTTGMLEVFPGAINSIPSRCMLGIDIRDTQLATRDLAVAGTKLTAREISERRALPLTIEMINSDPPATCDPRIVAAAERACEVLELKPLRMVSRAYHDSLFMARLFPTCMIFIPSRGGVSHRPDEYSSPEQIARGVEVLALTLAQLAE